jgi:glutamate--cysteine ligase
VTDPAHLLEDLRARVFAPASAPSRLGVEVELIPVSSADGRQVPIAAPAGGPATLPLLRAHAARSGWHEAPGPYGAPQWDVPRVGVVSYEPGGQIEVSAGPSVSAGALLRGVRGVVLPLRAALREEGVELLAAGVEPRHPLSTVPLQLPGERYRRLDAFLERIGTGGARMMRQTAAVQVSVDWGAEPLLAWRVLNAMAPCVVAAFASSPLHEGLPTGHRSTRAAIWRALDGGRTGIFPAERPEEEYLRFALEAPAILLGPEGEARAFATWLPEASPCDWRAHLGTLFPEVRPRGHAEVRSADAVEPEWYAAPLVLVGGVVGDPAALREAAALLGEPDAALLETAGREGLGDRALAATARDLAALALEGALRQPARFPGAVVEEAAAYFARYTLRGRAPADDVLEARTAHAG